MKNHKWDEHNVCVRCGIGRKRHTFKQLMAIVNHPPWDVWKYETGWMYITQDDKETEVRPNCK